MANIWYDKTGPEVAAILGTDLRYGLNEKQAENMRKRIGENNVYRSGRRSFLSYIRSMSTDITSLLLIFTAVIAAVFESSISATVTVFIIFINYLIIIGLFIHSQRSFENVSAVSLPVAKVLRNGKMLMMKYDRLVPGDIIYLSVGDIVPADCRLLEDNDLFIREGSVTGISTPVFKTATFISNEEIPFVEQRCIAFATTVVTGGTGIGIVIATGDDTAVAVLGKKPELSKHFSLDIVDSMKKFSRNYSLFTLALVMVFTILNIFTRAATDGLVGVFMSGLSVSVSTMSEYFPALTCIVIVLALDVIVKKRYRRGRIGAILKNISKLKKIREIDTVIVPCTGVISVHTPEISGIRVGEAVFDKKDYSHSPVCRKFLEQVVLTSGLVSVGSEDKNDNILMSGEQDAIKNLLRLHGISEKSVYSKYKVLDHRFSVGGSSCDAVLIQTGDKLKRIVKGDFDILFGECRYYRDGDKIKELTSDTIKEFVSAAYAQTGKYRKVTAVISDDNEYTTLTRFMPYSNKTVFEGFYLSYEAPSPKVSEKIAALRENGIQVIIVSENDNRSVRQIAKQVGVLESDSDVINGYSFKNHSASELLSVFGKYSYYENMGPGETNLLISALKSQKRKVAFLATGLSDLESMFESDLSMSLGLSFYDRTIKQPLNITSNVKLAGKKAVDTMRYNSDVLVSEGTGDGRGGFNAVYDILKQGRSVYLNLKFMLRYLTCSQILKIVVVLCSVFLGVNVISPDKLLFLGLIIDLIFVLSIALTKSGSETFSRKTDDTEAVLKKPLKNNLIPIIISALIGVLITSIPFLFYHLGYFFTKESITSFAFISVLFSQFVIYYEMSFEKGEKKKKHKLGVFFFPMFFITAVFVFLFVIFAPFGNYFGVGGLNYVSLLISVIIQIIFLIILEIQRRFF